MKPKLAILASGRGSNFQAIAEKIQAGALDAEIAILVSDRKKAPALEIARGYGIEAVHIPYDKEDREAFERQAGDLIEERGCDLVILAGFMRIVTPYLIARFRDRMLNIHPSLLHSFKGLHAQKQALEFGVKVAGCSVHIVTEEMDSGPIIGQRAVPVLDDDTEDSLSARILEQEHELFSECIANYGRIIGAKG